MAFCQNMKISWHTSILFMAHSLGNPELEDHMVVLLPFCALENLFATFTECGISSAMELIKDNFISKK